MLPSGVQRLCQSEIQAIRKNPTHLSMTLLPGSLIESDPENDL
ncbi:hypothetical protein HP15_918 [Marinobacter adhaerens HP15]|uniref:Uncharacterized protein n=1 Tax=Marinobacter adhaerens (strain DSM 23420 / HP15) TaxID=225937 RepID=E4PEX7_MARAH|nr:hypothetical protein HP15_918 [Marinobacter adhaerens HP15]